MPFERILKPQIEKRFHKNKAIILIGARQVGKTTLLNKILKDKDFIFLDGDDPSIRSILTNPNTEELKNIIGKHQYIFIDEAHLIFNEASKALLSQIESIVKLIRSKGIGLFFVTQNPNDVPEAVLAQLGLKVQHALRAFTAKDRKAIKLAAENYPDSEYYDVDQALTQLGIGEAFVSVLNEKGIPTPLACTMMRAPMSRMDILTDTEIKSLNEEGVNVVNICQKTVYDTVKVNEPTYAVITNLSSGT